MRSIALKLTIAFLLIGVLGSTVMAFSAVQGMRRGFERFVQNRDQVFYTDVLSSHYRSAGGWNGIEETLERGPNRKPLSELRHTKRPAQD